MPYCTDEFYLIFYGGEPLLAFDLIEEIVDFAGGACDRAGRKPSYAITTNGSLITPEIARFFDRNRFAVTLSFDGFGQERHRGRGTFQSIVSVLNLLREHSGIELETNSVYTPDTIELMTESVGFLTTMGISRQRYSLATIKPWDVEALDRLDKELDRLVSSLVRHRKSAGHTPVLNFRHEPPEGIFRCMAGLDRMSISPSGDVWGCAIFPSYFRGKEDCRAHEKYYGGNLSDFVKNHDEVYPRILENYRWLSTDNFSSPESDCFLCPDLLECGICPINAAFSGLPIGKVPQHLCSIKKIKAKSKRRFRAEIMKLQSERG